MNFERVKGQNFMTLGEFDVELTNRGLLLIQGENEDDDSADSNGAGKSSLPDSLAWCLFGITARGITGDAVVNRTRKKDCQVTTILRDNPTDLFTYEVTRHRKHSTGKNSLTLFKVEGGTRTDLTKGTDKETQAVVEQIVGCTAEVFCASVYAGQERMPDLPGMTDKALKSLIEQAAGVEELAAAYAEARGRLTVNKLQLDAARTAAATANTLMEEAQRRLAEAERLEVEFDATRKGRARETLATAGPLVTELKALTVELAGIDHAALIEKIREAQCKIDATKSENVKLDEHRRAVAERDRALALATSEARRLKGDNDAAVERLRRVDESVGKPCGECGKTYQSEDLATARAQRQKHIDDSTAALRVAAQALRDATTAKRLAVEAFDLFKASMTDVSAAIEQERTTMAALTAHDTKKQRVHFLNDKIATIKAQASAVLTAPNHNTALKASRAEDLANRQKMLDAAIAKVTELEAHAALLDQAVQVFGPAGVRAHILDTVTPFLNERTSKYLAGLSDGNLHAVWSTLTKTAKGELREKFNIEVTNDKGADCFEGLSGGEKRKVRLSTTMALQDLVASRATKPIGLFIGDEIDHALDQSSLERLMTLLEEKARERGTVLIISHNSLSDWCSNVLTVVKSGGVSKVTGEVSAFV